jgi:hypothetical protein
MSDNIKPSVPAQRSKQAVETSDFDAFARRILRAYGRRVAAGDVEALRSLAQLSADLDLITRSAVTGLRQAKPPYSWAEIASRLGITRQAAQMRFGATADRTRLDQRLIDNGLNIAVTDLVAVFIDHHPGTPASSTCPGCGYRYPDGVSDCPTNATVRPVLQRRRHETPAGLSALSPDQFADLTSETSARTNRVAARRAAQPSASPTTASLLDLIEGTH